jgi:hypothetical protein
MPNGLDGEVLGERHDHAARGHVDREHELGVEREDALAVVAVDDDQVLRAVQDLDDLAERDALLVVDGAAGEVGDQVLAGGERDVLAAHLDGLPAQRLGRVAVLDARDREQHRVTSRSTPPMKTRATS